jgi:hypothetical protein
MDPHIEHPENRTQTRHAAETHLKQLLWKAAVIAGVGAGAGAGARPRRRLNRNKKSAPNGGRYLA